MLWELEIRPAPGEVDREGIRIVHEAQALGLSSVRRVEAARLVLLEGTLDPAHVARAAAEVIVDPVAERYRHAALPDRDAARVTMSPAGAVANPLVLNVLYKPGVTDNVALSALGALRDLGLDVTAVATGKRYWIDSATARADLERASTRLLANEAVERVLPGALQLDHIGLGSSTPLQVVRVPLRALGDDELMQISRQGQLSLSLAEMQTIQAHYRGLDRDPTDIELETIAQTWSEHCSHKTLKGRIRYRDEHGERIFENMLKETIFGATEELRRRWGTDDWCVSVFKDNAGVVRFDDVEHACFKVETHNHPSAIEPYGGANTGLGGVIRDPLGTGLGARPICNTDVFCFAPPTTPFDALPPGVLPPLGVAKGVVSGVRDYGNRMGIPTVNGAVFFDPRYLGNPLVYCGTAAMLPVDCADKQVVVGDLIVAVGGRTGRDGIHGATFSSVELTDQSETLSGGAVQIGNAVMEKMVADVVLAARDAGLYHSITDCGAGGFSSAVGEMGEELGAEVWLDRAPLKYSGLTYTEIWISESQERMVLAVPPDKWEAFRALCAAEGVEATVIGQFTGTGRLLLKFADTIVGELSMGFLHDGRPPIVREATYQPPAQPALNLPAQASYNQELLDILGSWNVCSKEWIIRQYDHEVQAGSVVKPLVGPACDGPSDAAVVRPTFRSQRGLVISNGMNPRLGDLDPYWMALAALDEALRNCVAVGADPRRIAVLDNFCWGNTQRPETLGSLVRAALGCRDGALAFGTPFISGKDSLYNEFSYDDAQGVRQVVAIPSSLLISAMGQIADVSTAVTMDLKSPGNRLYLVGRTRDELGGSHLALVRGLTGGAVPRVDLQTAPGVFQKMHAAIAAGLVASCHDLSEGGLAVAAAEMAFAGCLGARVSLDQALRDADLSSAAVMLFSESTTRFLVEVPKTAAAAFEAHFEEIICSQIGVVTSEPQLEVTAGGQTLIALLNSEMKAVWRAPLAWE